MQAHDGGGEDNIDRAAFPCEMLYTEEQAAYYVKK